MRDWLLIAAMFALAALLWLLRWVPACAAFVLGDGDAFLEIVGGER